MIGINDKGGTDRGSVVFVHAHPDDEAIFTGGTIAALSRAGYRTVVLMATSGELGSRVGGDRSTTDVAARRRAEAERSCTVLGVDRLVFLDHVDSGIDDRATQRPWGAYVDVELTTAAEHPYGSAVYGSHYQGQRGPTPSRSHVNFHRSAL